jgi:hypothetical protein
MKLTLPRQALVKARSELSVEQGEFLTKKSPSQTMPLLLANTSDGRHGGRTQHRTRPGWALCSGCPVGLALGPSPRLMQ